MLAPLALTAAAAQSRLLGGAGESASALVDEGDVILTMHSIPHSGSRNEWGTPRMNMIWRIRAKKRQPNFVHNGGTDHPDRLGPNGINVRASLNRLNRCSPKSRED